MELTFYNQAYFSKAFTLFLIDADYFAICYLENTKRVHVDITDVMEYLIRFDMQVFKEYTCYIIANNISYSFNVVGYEYYEEQLFLELKYMDQNILN